MGLCKKKFTTKDFQCEVCNAETTSWQRATGNPWYYCNKCGVICKECKDGGSLFSDPKCPKCRKPLDFVPMDNVKNY